MRFAVLTAVFLVCAVGCSAPSEKLVFNGMGFAISPPDNWVKGEEGMMLYFYLNPSDPRGSPRVTVVAKKYSGSIGDYLAATKRQFGFQEATILAQRLRDNSCDIEFFNAKVRYHEYYRAVLKDGILCIAIGEASEDRWRLDGAKVRACVDSLEAGPAARLQVQLNFAKVDFSIAPLEEKINSGRNSVLIMYPEGYPSSCGVFVATEPFAGTIDEYLGRCKEELEDENWTILSCAVTGNALLLESSGGPYEKSYHRYQRAVLKNGIAYAVHAGNEEDAWVKISANLKACVDSLEVILGN
jgi:hypothetical protein